MNLAKFVASRSCIGESLCTSSLVIVAFYFSSSASQQTRENELDELRLF